jgi:hypothetical protein
MIRATLRLALLAACAASACGCATPPVQAWEKGALARPDMGFGGSAFERADEHVYTSREAASGGSGVGGGGCGCN